MTTIDYDAPRRSTDVGDDSAEDLPARRLAAPSPVTELDAPDALESFTLPGGELPDEEPTMTVVVPMRADEFRCSRCFLVCHRSRRAGGDEERDVCRECA